MTSSNGEMTGRALRQVAWPIQVRHRRTRYPLLARGGTSRPRSLRVGGARPEVSNRTWPIFRVPSPAASTVWWASRTGVGTLRGPGRCEAPLGASSGCHHGKADAAGMLRARARSQWCRSQKKTCSEFMRKKEWKPARGTEKEMAAHDWSGTGPCDAA